MVSAQWHLSFVATQQPRSAAGSTEAFCNFLLFHSGSGLCWSTTGRETSWWIWVQTRPPYTTHITEATTPSSSASARPISSCPTIPLDLKPWSKRGETNDTEGLCRIVCDIWVSEDDFNTCLHAITAFEDMLRPSISCLMLVCSSGTMATRFSWRPRELVSDSTLMLRAYSSLSVSPCQTNVNTCVSCFYRSRGKKGQWRSNWIPLSVLCTAHYGVRHFLIYLI